MSVSSNYESSESCRTTMTSLKTNQNEAKIPSPKKQKSPSPDNSVKSEHSVSTSSIRLKSTKESAGNATTKIIVTNSSLSESLKKPEVSKTVSTHEGGNSKDSSLKKDPPRPTSRPRTKTTVVRTNPLPKLRSSSLPKSDNSGSSSNSEHAKRLSCNNNNSCSSSGEEGSSSSSSSSSGSSSSSSYMLSRGSNSGLSRSCSLQPG